ncbi:MAG: hypothetical protein ACPG6V_11790, partial [Flavobacteriales bacterium]
KNKLETDYSTYISNKIDLTIENGNNISTLGVNFGINADYFEEKKGVYIESYSFCLLISFYSEDKLLIPFLKAFVKKYPEILVYNDELIDFNKETYRVYNKQDVEEVQDDDYWSLLGKEV